jgi:hypothetical protein
MPTLDRRTFALAGSFLAASVLAGPLPAQEPPAPAPLRMTAFAVNLSGIGSARPQTLQIVIERWSTDEERKKLGDTLVEKGGEKLVGAVQDIKPRAGFIRTTTSLGWDIQYARTTALPSGGQRIVFATDRPISFRELRESTRSTDYEFMVCEIRLGPDGKGEGKLAGATKVTYDAEKKQLELENYGQQPARLTQVTVDK